MDSLASSKAGQIALPAAAGALSSMSPGAARGLRGGFMTQDYVNELNRRRRLKEFFSTPTKPPAPPSVYDASRPPTTADAHMIGEVMERARQVGAEGYVDTALGTMTRLAEVVQRDNRPMSLAPGHSMINRTGDVIRTAPYTDYTHGGGNIYHRGSGEASISPVAERELRMQEMFGTEKMEQAGALNEARIGELGTQSSANVALAGQRETAADLNRQRIEKINAEIAKIEAEPDKYNIQELVSLRRSYVSQLEDGDEAAISKAIDALDNIINARIESVSNPDDDATDEGVPMVASHSGRPHEPVWEYDEATDTMKRILSDPEDGTEATRGKVYDYRPGTGLVEVAGRVVRDPKTGRLVLSNPDAEAEAEAYLKGLKRR